MRPTTSVVSLIALVALSCGGSDANSSDAGVTADAFSGPDAEAICRVLGDRVNPAQRAHNDFELSCGGGAAALDDAYTWTAPSAGFYQFTAQALSGASADAPAIAILDGTCAGDELACACHSYDVSGEKESTSIVYVDKDQVVTVVAEDCAGAAAESNLVVIERQCPVGAAAATGTTALTMMRGEAIKLPCSTCFDGSRACVQTALSWTAPMAGTYSVAVAEGYAADSVAVGVLSTDCRGQVAGCEIGDMRASVSVTATTGQVMVIVVESTFYDEPPMGYAAPILRVQRTIENP